MSVMMIMTVIMAVTVSMALMQNTRHCNIYNDATTSDYKHDFTINILWIYHAINCFI